MSFQKRAVKWICISIMILYALAYLLTRLSDVLILDGIEGGYISTGDYLPSLHDQNLRSKIIEGIFYPFIFVEDSIRSFEYNLNKEKYLEEEYKAEQGAAPNVHPQHASCWLALLAGRNRATGGRG